MVKLAKCPLFRCSLHSFLLAAAILSCLPAAARSAASANVMQFGAHADGKTDDTKAFQAALDARAGAGGVVFAPAGNYYIATHLNIPSNVTLQGVWHAPPKATHETGGTTLLAVEGAGSETGTPFITMNTNSTLEGITVDYPNQSMTAIVPYPWCIASAGGDDDAIVNCLLVDPYQAVDFGTHSAARHTIRGLYGQPLRAVSSPTSATISDGSKMSISGPFGLGTIIPTFSSTWRKTRKRSSSADRTGRM